MSRDFLLLVFSWISFPPAPEYSIKTVSNFLKILGDIRSSRFATGVNDTGGKWKKSSIRKIVIILFGHLGSRGNIYINFCLQVHFQVSAAWYCSNYLPPVSTTQWELVAKFAAGVVDTGGKFAAGVVNTGGNSPPGKFATGVVSLTPVANLPPVLLTPVVHLDLRTSPRIFEKIWNDSYVIIRGLGEGDSWKKPEVKNLVTLSL